MDIKSLLSENNNYMSQLRSDLNAYLIRLKANNMESISTDVMVRELKDLGYTINIEALVDILLKNKYIKSATADTIELRSTRSSSVSPEADDANRAAVKKLAMKATTKRIN